MRNILIKNGQIVLKDRVVSGDLEIYDGKIARILESGELSFFGAEEIDANGNFIFPGFIDMHSDTIEQEIEVRPGVYLPLEIALTELDKRLASSGVTTMYYSLTFSDDSKRGIIRSFAWSDKIVHAIKAMANDLSVNSKVHVRYEITDAQPFPIIKNLIEENLVDLVSFMDHTPGQGQFRTVEQFKNYYGRRFSNDEKIMTAVMEERIANREAVGVSNAEKIAKLCQMRLIPIASHDDDTAEKIDIMKEMGAVISEFPMSIEAAERAGKLGMAVAVGAPNIVRGKSHNNNLSACELINKKLATIVCSDYIPQTLLHAMHILIKNCHIAPWEVANLFSTNPASVLGIEKTTGSIQPGLDADLIIVDLYKDIASIKRTFVEGRGVYSVC